MTDQDKYGSGCIAVGVILLILLGLGWLLLPRLLFGYRRHYNARLEARASVGSMARAQQAHYLDQGEFAAALAPLGLGLKPETDDYLYQTQVINRFAVQNNAVAKGQRLHHVIGVVWQVEDTRETNAQLCERDQPTETALISPSPLLVRVLHWFQPAKPAEIPPDVIPTFELPAFPVAPDIIIPCPVGYSPL